MPQPEEIPSQESGTKRRSKKPPEPDTGPTCGQCKHWRRKDGDEGLCYRYPPSVHYDEEGGWIARPPVDSTEHACGEFRGAN
jgi:hypothetical protein